MMGMNLSKLHKLTPCFPVTVLILAQQNVFFRTHEERSVVFYPPVFAAPVDIRMTAFLFYSTRPLLERNLPRNADGVMTFSLTKFRVSVFCEL